MQFNDKEEKIDFKKFFSEWKVDIKSRWWILLVELAVIAVILVADLLTKKYASEFLLTQSGFRRNDFIPGLINLYYTENDGAGFSIFQGKTVALTVITCIVVVCLAVYLFFALKQSEWLRISLVFITAGGIGNIVDRIAFGYVRDFIEFAFWKEFAVFNIADSFVTVGAFMLIIVLIVMLVKEGKKNQKEFEEKQAANPTVEEGVDPLDMPQNLNPMLKSENEFTFEQPKTAIDVKTENADNDAESVAENAENDSQNSSNDEVKPQETPSAEAHCDSTESAESEQKEEE